MVREVESQGVELKHSVDNFRVISKTVCAFANAFGGRIIVGISDKGKVFGVPSNEADLLQQRLEGTIQQVSPVPFHKIVVEERGGKKIVVSEIYQIGHGAFCTFGGIVYYRSGSLNSKLEGKTLQDFMVKKHILSFDESVSKAKIEDIDVKKLKDFLKLRSPSASFEDNSVEAHLINLGLAQKNGALSIKNTAVLFFSLNPSRFLPQNELKLAQFSGTKPIDIIDSRFVSSTVLEELKEAEEFIRKNTRTAFKIEKLERTEVPEYPVSVIREALVNALVHRDYFSGDAIQINIFDDRIEFINPGSLPSGLSLQILGTLSIQRNPQIYRLMRELKLVEGLATGIPRMRSAMALAKLPQPVFEELGSFFRVTLYNKQKVGVGELNERQKRALSYLEKNPSVSSKTYSKLASVSHPVAVSDLNKLVELGLIKKIGKTRGSYYIKNKQA